MTSLANMETYAYIKPEFYLDTTVFWQKPIFAGKIILPVRFLPWKKPFIH